MRVVERDWEHQGLRCLVTLDEELVEEWYSGYVALPRGHPDWGKKLVDVDVHGGVTFAEQGSDDTIWKDGKLWWLGFNCAHASDDTFTRERIGENPYLENGTEHPLHKWTLDEVVVETEKLAEQLAKRKSPA
jgi:hypothetical protein